MALMISDEQLAHINDKIESGKKSLVRLKERAKESTGRILHQGEAAATAFGVGYMRGRQPDKFAQGIFGQAPDLLAAVALDGAVMLGYAGGLEDHVFAVSTGALCGYMTALGMKKGAAAAVTAKEKPGPYLGDPDMGASIHAEGASSSSASQIRALMEELKGLRAAA